MATQTKQATPSTFAEIMAYVGQFHRDVGQMIALVEKLMSEEGYEGLPYYGNKACWQLTSHWSKSDQWCAPYIARVYVPEEETEYTAINVVMAHLQSNTAFDFPPLICAHYEHPPLTGRQINNGVFDTFRLRSLTGTSPLWRDLSEENGWSLAQPKYGNKSCSLKGYILNLFDMVDPQTVVDNVIQPLLHPEDNLDDMLTVTKYRFPAMDGE